jgi:hypothetical protein
MILVKKLAFSVFCAAFSLHLASAGQAAASAASENNQSVVLDTAVKRTIYGNNNDIRTVNRELLDPKLLAAIASGSGLSQGDLATVSITQKPEAKAILFCQIGKSDKAFKVLRERLDRYIRGRAEGHTAAFVVSTFTNRTPPKAVSDPNLRLLLEHDPSLPVLLMRRAETGSYTNKAGGYAGEVGSATYTNGQFVFEQHTNYFKQDEVVRWARYVLVDGEIAWRYQLTFDPSTLALNKLILSVGGTPVPSPNIASDCADSQEFEGKYVETIRKVSEELKVQMTQEGGWWPPWEFNARKQEKLRSLGINWRTPGHLYPSRWLDEGRDNSIMY